MIFALVFFVIEHPIQILLPSLFLFHLFAALHLMLQLLYLIQDKCRCVHLLFFLLPLYLLLY